MMWHHLLAALISCLGVFASYYFLKPQDWGSQHHTEKKVLANLVKSSNDVRKKASNKFIWEPIQQGDELSHGEMLKTAEDSSASIKFIKNGTTMDLEPNSLVMIEESHEDVSLGVLEGGLFVSSVEKEKGQGKIRLKSGQKSVDLSQGEVSFSVSKSGEVGVQVHSGQVEATVGNKALTLSGDDVGTLSDQGIKKTQQVFQEIRPNFGEVIYLALQSGSKATFQWKPLQPGFTVYLEMGLNRQKMGRIEGYSAAGESGKLIAPIHTGLFYWQLVAIPKDSREDTVYSMVNKNLFQVKQPPILLSPENQEKIYLAKGEQLEFKWNLPTPTEQLILEVANDLKFENILFQQNVTGTTSHKTEVINKNGSYSWRVKGILKDSMESVTSNPSSFLLTVGVQLKPPKLLSPEHNAIQLMKDNTSFDMQLIWQRESTGMEYRVFLKRVSGGSTLQVDKSTKDPQFTFKGLTEGVYEWSVATLGENQRSSEFAPKRTFRIQRMGNFNWIGIKPKYLYIDQFPKILLKWERFNNPVSYYEIKVSLQKDLSLANQLDTKELQIPFTPQSEGIHFAQVAAMNADKNILALTPIISFDVVKSPLPKPPRFSEKMKAILLALPGGILPLEFLPSEEVQYYFIEVTTLKGELVQTLKWEKAQGNVENLLPGQYWVRAKSQDKAERESGYSESRKVTVPNRSNISAPPIRNVKIKGNKK